MSQENVNPNTVYLLMLSSFGYFKIYERPHWLNSSGTSKFLRQWHRYVHGLMEMCGHSLSSKKRIRQSKSTSDSLWSDSSLTTDDFINIVWINKGVCFFISVPFTYWCTRVRFVCLAKETKGCKSGGRSNTWEDEWPFRMKRNKKE